MYACFFFLSTETTALGPVSSSGVFRLKSGFLNISEDSCLEFWYHKPNQKSSELKVLVVDDILHTLIWTSETSSSGDWRQVFIPLTKQSDNTQVEQFKDSDLGVGNNANLHIFTVLQPKPPNLINYKMKKHS